jgi:hypothetical protein
MRSFVTVLSVLLCHCFGSGLAARILLVPPQYESFIIQQILIGEVLSGRGHEVNITVGSRYSALDSLRKAGIQPLTFFVPQELPYAASSDAERMVHDVAFSQTSNLEWSPLFYTYCELMMSDHEFLDSVGKIKFDFALTATFPLTPCNLIIPHFFGLPFATISVTLFPGPWSYGIPALPSFYELSIVKNEAFSFRDLSRFTERLVNTVVFLAVRFKAASLLWSNTSLLERYASPGVTSWTDLLHRSEIFLNDDDHHLNDPLPLMPNVVSIAGMTVRPAKPLPEALEKIFVDSQDAGVILMSFGSSVYSLPIDIVNKLLYAFSRVKQTVVMRFVIPDGVKIPFNVRPMTWLPQNDILGHNKTRLFITHCGSKGQYEALYHGVPMLGLSLFAEQSFNCERMRRKGFGVKMDIRESTALDLYNGIREMLDNASYAQT